MGHLAVLVQSQWATWLFWYWVSGSLGCSGTESVGHLAVLVLSQWATWLFWYWVSGPLGCSGTESMGHLAVLVLSQWATWLFWYWVSGPLGCSGTESVGHLAVLVLSQWVTWLFGGFFFYRVSPFWFTRRNTLWQILLITVNSWQMPPGESRSKTIPVRGNTMWQTDIKRKTLIIYM